MEMTKKLHILVTGGAGFIGSHLVDELVNKGHRVVVLDNLANGSLENLNKAKKHKNFLFIKGDICKDSDCRRAVKGAQAVYHLACLGVRHSIHSPVENHRVNAEGTLRILEACRSHDVQKFFYISTSEIYGGTTTFPISESAVPVPFTVYGASKLAGEHYANAYHTCFGMNTTVVRLFNNYGPRAHYENDAGEIIPRTIVTVLRGRRPMLFGDGTITRDFIFVKDTAAALHRLLNNKGCPGLTMNMGSGKEISMRDVLEKILCIMGKKELSIDYLPSRPADVPRLWVNADRFYAITGFKPSVSFDEGLRQTARYYTDLFRKGRLNKKMPLKNWEP